jgi:hypothetical protein
MEFHNIFGKVIHGSHRGGNLSTEALDLVEEWRNIFIGPRDAIG